MKSFTAALTVLAFVLVGAHAAPAEPEAKEATPSYGAPADPEATEATPVYGAYAAKETSNASPGFTYVPKSGCSYSSETKPEGSVITEKCGNEQNTITLKDGFFVDKTGCAYASISYDSEDLTVFLENCSDKKGTTPYLLRKSANA